MREVSGVVAPSIVHIFGSVLWVGHCCLGTAPINIVQQFGRRGKKYNFYFGGRRGGCISTLLIIFPMVEYVYSLVL